MDSHLFDHLKQRRSIRRYSEREVSLDVIRGLLDIGMHAPSAHNSQPWRYVIIPKGDAREELIKVMSDAFRKDLSRNGKTLSEIDDHVNLSEERLRSASKILLVCLSMEDMWEYGDSRDEAEFTMAVQSVAASIQNILIAAHIQGLGCCWMCAPLFVKDEVSKTLSLPKDYNPQAFVLIGYPDESPEMPKRKSVEDVTRIVEEKST